MLSSEMSEHGFSEVDMIPLIDVMMRYPDEMWVATSQVTRKHERCAFGGDIQIGGAPMGDFVGLNAVEPSGTKRAPWFVACCKGSDHSFDFVNDSYVTHFGARPYEGHTVRQLFPEILDQPYLQVLDMVFRTGDRISLKLSPLRTYQGTAGPLVERIIDINFIPTRDARGNVSGIYLEGLISSPTPMDLLSDRATRRGLTGLEDTEILALLVYQQSGGSDAPHIADQLLKRFSSLGGVLSASLADMERVAPALAPDGLRTLEPSTALHLKLVREIGRRILRQKIGRRRVLSSSSLVRAYLSATLRHVPREEFHVLFLDNSLNLIVDEVLSQGTISQVTVYSREVIRRALELSATSLILVHNHPSGNEAASWEDREMTAEITRAGHALGVEVNDHLIVSGGRVISFAAEGLLKDQRRVARGKRN